jgi:hypothetical protein
VNRLLVALAFSAALAGCTVHTIRLDNLEYARYDETRPSEVRGEACGALLVVIPLKLNSHLIRAQRAMREQAPNSVFTDVRVQQHWMWIGLPFFCTELTATAYPRLP